MRLKAWMITRWLIFTLIYCFFVFVLCHRAFSWKQTINRNKQKPQAAPANHISCGDYVAMAAVAIATNKAVPLAAFVSWLACGCWLLWRYSCLWWLPLAVLFLFFLFFIYGPFVFYPPCWECMAGLPWWPWSVFGALCLSLFCFRSYWSITDTASHSSLTGTK